MNSSEHKTLLEAIDYAFANLQVAKKQVNGLPENIEDLHRLENEWQESLESYNDFFSG
jgi:hypothetical protein